MMPPEVAILLAALCGPPFQCTMIAQEPGFWAFSRHYRDERFESCVVMDAEKWRCVSTEQPLRRSKEFLR